MGHYTQDGRDNRLRPDPSPPRGGYRYATPRDVLTGEPIQPGAIVKCVSEGRVDSRPTRVAYRDGWRADITSQPLRLHTAEVETTGSSDGAPAPDARGSLGGHAYSRDMGRYLQSSLDLRRDTERADTRRWERSAYGRGRVYAAFVARFGPERGYIAYQAALAYVTGEMDADAIVRETGHTVAWVGHITDQARKAGGATPPRPSRPYETR